MFLNLRVFLICVIAIINVSEASILSWLTGGNRSSTLSPLNSDLSLENSPSRVSPYTEERGECAHWGNRELPSYSGNDPTYSSSSRPSAGGALIGSHKGVPVGSIVAVTNTDNGKTVRVRMVPPQTMPVVGRVMDLSPAAFSQLGVLRDAVIPCSVRIVQTPGTEMHSLTSQTYDNAGIRKPTFPFSPTLISAGSIPRDTSGENRYMHERWY